MHPPDNVNVSDDDEPDDEPVSQSLDSTERSFLSQRQCRLIYQQLRKSDLGLEESFSALMHGNGTDGRLCVLEVCAARDSPLTNYVRQRLHDNSVTDRRTSRDHDLSKDSGQRSALKNLELVRPNHDVFSPPVSDSLRSTSNGRRSDRERHIVFCVQLVGSKNCLSEMRMFFVECASDSVIPKFLRASLDTFWSARIDLCMYDLVQPQTHLPTCRSVFVYASSRLVFEALDRRCEGHCGLPHAVLNSGNVSHVSFLPKQFMNLFEKTNVKSRILPCAREIRERLTELSS